MQSVWILLLVICGVFISMGQEWVGTRPRVLPWSRSCVADRVRLGVRTEGLYAVSAEEVAAAMGLSLPIVSEAFQTTNLTLSCQGQPVACTVYPDQLFFKGESALTNRVPENVYWLELDTDVVSPELPPEEPPAQGWALATTTVQGTNTVSYSNIGTLTHLPSFLAFNQVSAAKSYTLTNRWSDGVTHPVTGTLSVTLLSAANETAPDQHSARVSVNGVEVGTAAWEAEQYLTFTFTVPGELLTNGLAVIRVDNLVASGTSARFFWTKFALAKARRTDLQTPLCYPSVRGVLDADGYLADNTADYVVLIPPEGWTPGFRGALQPLVSFRARQGLRPAILDVESLYNRFTYGLAKPEAIRAFCRNAYTSPDIKLRYLLLAGAGSLDFSLEKYAVTNYQACLLPPLIASQRIPLTGESMIVAVDQAFGDVSGDAVPEIAIGRLPTAWTQEVAVAVAKTLAYETLQPWKLKAALSAGIPFTQDMNLVSNQLFSAGRVAATYYPATQTTWNNALKAGFQSGVGSFWYVGHSSDSYLGESSSQKLLEISTLKTTSWLNKPFAALMGCHLNRWQGMNAANPNEASTLGAYSVFKEGTGFSAVFASTGYTWDGVQGSSGEAQMLAYYLSACSASNGVYRLGDAICSAFKSLIQYDPLPSPGMPNYDPPPISAERLQSYSLVGDPALIWRHDHAGTGTPLSWLQSYGLTAWDGDVSDRDGDGWAAWQEYQAGTGPETNRLLIASCSLLPGNGWMGLTFETDANKAYRVLWKYSLEDSEPWQPISWARAGQTNALYSAEDLIVPTGPATSLCLPLRPGDRQGFYRVSTEP